MSALVCMQAAIVDAVLQAVIFAGDLSRFTHGKGQLRVVISHGVYLAIILLKLCQHGFRKGRCSTIEGGGIPHTIHAVGLLAWAYRICVHLACAAGLMQQFKALSTMARLQLEPFVEWVHNSPCKQVGTRVRGKEQVNKSSSIQRQTAPLLDTRTGSASSSGAHRRMYFSPYTPTHARSCRVTCACWVPCTC